jgi:predicted nuclease of predicted toxin-antitoxin system
VIKFIIDPQLPFSLSVMLRERGYDIIHTDDLPDEERTTDRKIRALAKEENRIVIRTDIDFFDSYILNKSPVRLDELYAHE